MGQERWNAYSEENLEGPDFNETVIGLISNEVVTMDFQHTPVLLETIRYLDIRQDGVYVDGTVGGAGHSKKILELLSEKGLLICLDQDEKAIEAAGKKLEGAKNVILLKTNFVNLISVCNSLGVSKVDGILFDLGVSSHQFDTPERGFSYRFDSKLDMRMDADSELTAYDVVNGYEAELRRIIKEYGKKGLHQGLRKIVKDER